MKKLVLLIFSLIFCWNCSSEDKSLEPSMEITSSTSLTLDADATVANIIFTTNIAWTASCNQLWCTLSSTYGESGKMTLAVNVAENDSYDVRIATVKLQVATLEKDIVITQSPKDVIMVKPSEIDVSANGDKVEIEVKTNVDFTYEMESDASQWISRENTRGMLTSILVFNVDANKTNKKREGIIFIKGGSLVEKIVVSQEGAFCADGNAEDYDVEDRVWD